jgi:hypothetical protein
MPFFLTHPLNSLRRTLDKIRMDRMHGKVLRIVQTSHAPTPFEDERVFAKLQETSTPPPEYGYDPLSTWQRAGKRTTWLLQNAGLRDPGQRVLEAACGDGPVDATFKAIERAVGMKISLEDYYLKSITGGQDALGEVTVRVSGNGGVFTGRGISTDVIEASAKAYINAINKLSCAPTS